MAALTLEALTVKFGGLTAVNGLDLQIRDGELRCLLGPNGAGKSTTLDLICGKTAPTSGRIILGNQDITNLPEFKRARAGVGRKFQTPSVFKDLTVIENLEVGRSSEPGLLSTLRVFRSPVRGRMREVLELVGLEDAIHTRAENLSHGQTQWLEIAMLLMQDCRVILMDEPTAGMTVQETRQTAELFRTLRGDHTMIVVEHDMTFVRDIAETVTVMDMGGLLAEGSIAEVEANPAVREAYLADSGEQDHA
ncbi:urea ABC transporter ATP-binding protein UrtD [Aquisalimonas asiatica]|uniref:Urea transport system ATP-binding protein n=1 Tax=Aquisalimonas asiatica TaxID=406100 RepID=A0A1H8V1S8_9GAMM|nr:urea ABC transporter ATP-binding protein UrtD [Aquisalimonas asiatica]SEP08718.1 urea transport system ATP-binding protein [Aquisalimonas asiatica]